MAHLLLTSATERRHRATINFDSPRRLVLTTRGVPEREAQVTQWTVVHCCADSVTMKTVIVMVGLPGSGKTTAATWLAERLNFVLISRDEIKRVLFGYHDVGVPQNAHAFRVMKNALTLGLDISPGIILDGMPFSREGQVEDIAEICEEYGARVIPIVLQCTVEVAARRLSSPDLSGPRDRDGDLVERVARDFRAIPKMWKLVDAGQPVECVQREIWRIVASQGVTQ